MYACAAPAAGAAGVFWYVKELHTRLSCTENDVFWSKGFSGSTSSFLKPCTSLRPKGAPRRANGAESASQHTRDTPLARRLMKRRLEPYPSRKV